ncbi:B12-binding domain-containing radical SAM protein [Thermodesulfobacteriota bacterium]
MKVLLLNPPERNVVQANLPGAVEGLRGATPPIGLMYVASAARSDDRHEVSILDAHALDLDYDELRKVLGEKRPDIVGITMNSFTLLDALETVKSVRRVLPETVVVAGGLQPFLFPEETARLGAFDYSLQGEAEETFPMLLDALSDGKSVESIPGILFLRDGSVVSQPVLPGFDELDSLPFPAHDLIPLPRYSSLVADLHPVSIMVTSRGCPFRCSFCSRSVTGKVYRFRSARNVVEEMEMCQALGIRYLLIYDEVMTVQRERVLDICHQIRSRGIRMKWMARARAETIEMDMLKAMKGAGCDLVTLGIESGSPRVLARLNRPVDLTAAKDFFKQAREAGLRSIAYFMIGNPDETMDDVRESLDVAVKARPDMIHASAFMPYPATDLYEEGLETGRFEVDYWRVFAAKPSTKFRPRLWTKPGGEKEIEKRLFWFYRRFYLRPSYILRRACNPGGWKGMGQNVRGLLALIVKRRWSFDT